MRGEGKGRFSNDAMLYYKRREAYSSHTTNNKHNNFDIHESGREGDGALLRYGEMQREK